MKYIDSGAALFGSERRESCGSLQDEQQLCGSEICFLFYNKASVKTCNALENVKVFRC